MAFPRADPAVIFQGLHDNRGRPVDRLAPRHHVRDVNRGFALHDPAGLAPGTRRCGASSCSGPRRARDPCSAALRARAPWPLSPRITRTVSFFRMFIACFLYHFGARDRIRMKPRPRTRAEPAECACPGLFVRVNKHRRVTIEADRRPVRALRVLAYTHHRLHDVALLDVGVGKRLAHARVMISPR